jgi:hypothetical protein
MKEIGLSDSNEHPSRGRPKVKHFTCLDSLRSPSKDRRTAAHGYRKPVMIQRCFSSTKKIQTELSPSRTSHNELSLL